jgi:hypothetical protein
MTDGRIVKALTLVFAAICVFLFLFIPFKLAWNLICFFLAPLLAIVFMLGIMAIALKSKIEDVKKHPFRDLFCIVGISVLIGSIQGIVIGKIAILPAEFFLFSCACFLCAYVLFLFLDGWLCSLELRWFAGTFGGTFSLIPFALCFSSRVIPNRFWIVLGASILLCIASLIIWNKYGKILSGLEPEGCSFFPQTRINENKKTFSCK